MTGFNLEHIIFTDVNLADELTTSFFVLINKHVFKTRRAIDVELHHKIATIPERINKFKDLDELLKH